MIDLNKFYKFEVGLGVHQDGFDVQYLGYVLTPSGEKIVGKSRSLDLTMDNLEQEKYWAVEALVAYLLRSADLHKRVELHEQSKQE